MKTISFFCLVSLLLCGCKKTQEASVPNYFKHGMKGEVKSVFTQSYTIKDGNREAIPSNYIVVWGDKFQEACSHKEFYKNGNISEVTTYTKWATYTDSTVTSFNYQDGSLLSYTDKFYWREYQAPNVTSFVYDKRGVLTGWGEKAVKVNTDSQIEDISYSIKIGNIDKHRKEVYNTNGDLVSLFDMSNSSMTIHNSFDEDGKIVKVEEFGNMPASRNIMYSKFDKFGNWTERLIIGLEHNDTIVQCRTISYYKDV